MLSVPLDYADPGGRHISLALDMIPATAPPSQQQGILLVNPGGPGGSGLTLAVAVAQGLAPGVTADYDIVGFDPRGVGSSVPALSCDPSFFSGARPNYIPANPTAEQAQISLARLYADDCEQKFGWLLPYMTTEDAARDLDSIRAAFGVSKINYYAFSYGTYLGQVYATLFPARVRRMVLDSTVDPTGAWYTDNIDQDYAFDQRQDAFYAWMARYNATFHLGDTAASVRAAYYRARNRLAADPINGQLGPDELDDTFLAGGYDDELWPGLAQALSLYLNSGQGADLIAQYQAHGTQIRERVRRLPRGGMLGRQLAAQLGLLDLRYGDGLPGGSLRGVAERLVQRRVRVLAGARPGQAAADPRGRAARHLDAAGHAGRGDPVRGRPGRAQAAPVRADGRRHRQRQPRSVASDNPPDACVQNYLNAYLATGALPNAPGLVNATCPAVPVPTAGP